MYGTAWPVSLKIPSFLLLYCSGLIVEEVYFLCPFPGSNDLVHDSFGSSCFGSNRIGGSDHCLAGGSCYCLGSLGYSLLRIGCSDDSLRCFVCRCCNLQYLDGGLRKVCLSGSLHLLVWVLGLCHSRCSFVFLDSTVSFSFCMLRYKVQGFVQVPMLFFLEASMMDFGMSLRILKAYLSSSGAS